MTTTHNMKLSFRRCWINKTNDFKSDMGAYSVLNIEDCPIVQAADGIISGTYDVAGITRCVAADHPFSDGQIATIITSGGTYTGSWVVSNVVAGATFDINTACTANESGTWAGSFDVSDSTHQVKITMKYSTLKDTDFTQGYVTENSVMTGCKVSNVVFGKVTLYDVEEMVGSSYLALEDDAVCENVKSIHLTPVSGTDLYYIGGSIANSLDLSRFNDNRITLSNTTLYGNVDLDSDANIGIQVLNSFVVGRMSMASAGITSASAIIAKNSAIGDVIATGGGLIDFSNTKCGSMTGSDTATVKLKTCEIETDLTMGAGTTLEKKNTHVGGSTLIDNGVAVSYGDAEKAMKIAQLIMTGN